MLLQIQEPDSFAVGIDLGTTNSLVCTINDEGNPVFLTDLIPSVTHNIESFKRHMSNPKKLLPNKHTPFHLTLDLIKNLKNLAEKNAQKVITHAVITVPAHFNDTARNATKEAANLAGIEVLRLINEPTAAALAYGVKDGFYLVYDFGGGTFDVSLIRLEKNVFHVLKTDGDLDLGGDDLDQAISLHFSLSSLTKAKALKESGSRKNEIEQIIKPYLEKTLIMCESLICQEKEGVDGILLVGGSSRLICLPQLLKDRLHINVLSCKDLQHVVARGAAIQASALMSKQHSPSHLLIDVTPLSLGIEIMGGVNEKIILRNSPIPTQRSEEFTTFYDGQTKIKIHVVQGENEHIEKCHSLAEFVLEDLPAMPAGQVRVKVIFRIDENGILNVKAFETTTNIQKEIRVQAKKNFENHEFESLLH